MFVDWINWMKQGELGFSLVRQPSRALWASKLSMSEAAKRVGCCQIY